MSKTIEHWCGGGENLENIHREGTWRPKAPNGKKKGKEERGKENLGKGKKRSRVKVERGDGEGVRRRKGGWETTQKKGPGKKTSFPKLLKQVF